MILDNSAESGAEMWICLSSDRRMLLRWPPDYEKLVLVRGEDTAIYVGGKGGLQVSDVAADPPPSRDVPAKEYLWLRDHGIDWDGTPG